MRIKELRQKRNLSQDELAELSGVQQYLISSYEVGRREPNIKTMRKLAKALNVKITELFEESEI